MSDANDVVSALRRSSDVYKGYSGVMLKPRRMYEADIFPDARPIREDGFPVMLESDL